MNFISHAIINGASRPIASVNWDRMPRPQAAAPGTSAFAPATAAAPDPMTRRRAALEAVARTGGAEAREAKRMLGELDAPRQTFESHQSMTAASPRGGFVQTRQDVPSIGGASADLKARSMNSMLREMREMGIEPVRR